VTNDFLRQCYQNALQKSDDPTTKNGALIVDPLTKQVLAIGVNRFPRQIRVTPDRLVRETKYRLMIHAEMDSILQAAAIGVSTQGRIMFCP
jgi:deoxycytidylate deaminase